MNWGSASETPAGSQQRSAPYLRSLLVVRLGAMGDVIHTLPAVSALRSAFPQTHIGWLIEERWADLLCAPGYPRRGPRATQRPLVDQVHAVDLKAWGRSLTSVPVLQKIATVWNDVRDVHYTAAIDLQGNIRSSVLARLSGAPVVYGTAEPRESPASLLYSRQGAVHGRHVIEQNLSLAEAMIRSICGRVPPLSVHPDLPRDSKAEMRIDQFLAQERITEFAILNPGAGWGAKRWPAERYGAVARALRELGIATVVNCGPAEGDLLQTVLNASHGSAKTLPTSIAELTALTRRARLFIGGDTGPLHLAAALGVPVVAIFGPTDPARNGPFVTRSIVLRNKESLTTYTRNFNADEALLSINVDQVIAAAKNLLGIG